MPNIATRLVLYVEDDRINIVLMEEAFRALPDWQLECVETGAQALRLLAKMPRLPDLVVIDMNLPDMSGFNLIEHLRSDARLRALPCVALSADDHRAQVLAARAAGFADYWVKPVSVRDLSEMLQAALSEPRQHADQP